MKMALENNKFWVLLAVILMICFSECLGGVK